MVFAEIESQLRTEGGWNMHIAIALIMALLVTAGVLWFFFAPRKAYRAPLRDGVQEAVVEVKGGYNPAVIEAEAGMPLRLIFDRKEDGECSSHVVFSDFGVDLALPAFRTTTLTLHPDQPGEYPFACGMNMLHGTLRILPGSMQVSVPPPVPRLVPSAPVCPIPAIRTFARLLTVPTHPVPRKQACNARKKAPSKRPVRVIRANRADRNRKFAPSSPVLSWRPSARFRYSAPPCSCCIRCRTGCSSC